MNPLPILRKLTQNELPAGAEGSDELYDVGAHQLLHDRNLLLHPCRLLPPTQP
jgi:hypothetical protein